MGESIVQNLRRRVLQAPMLRPLEKRNFRLLWFSQIGWSMAEQVFFVGLSWLVLQLTGSGAMLGTVLMTAGIPRAALMLIGGALSDRISPRLMLTVWNTSHGLLNLLLAVLVISGEIRVWMLYAFAATFGVVDAIGWPAYLTLIPRVINRDQLEAGNAFLEGTFQLTVFVGPAPAGLLIAWLGMGAPFACNALFCLLSTVTLIMMKDVPKTGAEDETEEAPLTKLDLGAITRDISEGIRSAWSDAGIRTVLFVIAAADFMLIGPIDVGIPYLSEHRFGGSSVVLGVILSALGAGSVLGTVIAGSIGQMRRIGALMLLMLVEIGVCVAMIGFAPGVVTASLLAGGLGVGSGLVWVLLLAWLQRRADPSITGRVMSLVGLASAGVQPFSNALAGFTIDLHTAMMFVGAGSILVGVAVLLAVTSSTARNMENL